MVAQLSYAKELLENKDSKTSGRKLYVVWQIEQGGEYPNPESFMKAHEDSEPRASFRVDKPITSPR